MRRTQAWGYINTRVLPYRKGTGGGRDRNDEVMHTVGQIEQELGMTPARSGVDAWYLESRCGVADAGDQEA